MKMNQTQNYTEKTEILQKRNIAEFTTKNEKQNMGSFRPHKDTRSIFIIFFTIFSWIIFPEKFVDIKYKNRHSLTVSSI